MYAAGLGYMLLLTILFSAGILVYYIARSEEKEVPFTSVEKLVALAIFTLGIITVIMAVMGKTSI